MMTESYSSPETIKKFYKSDTKDGAHHPFNFQLITAITSASKANDIVKTITDWMGMLPAGKTTNWVVSQTSSRVIKRI